jgi:hypothetical protein
VDVLQPCRHRQVAPVVGEERRQPHAPAAAHLQGGGREGGEGGVMPVVEEERRQSEWHKSATTQGGERGM